MDKITRMIHGIKIESEGGRLVYSLICYRINGMSKLSGELKNRLNFIARTVNRPGESVK